MPVSNEPHTDAEWQAYWKAYDARLALAAADRRADRLAAMVDRELARPIPADQPHRFLCPAGTPYAGRG